MEKIFYVYHHINKKTGEIFYVGKGKNNRAYSKRSRSEYWYNIVNKYGYDVIIVEDNLFECEALDREIYWINKIGRKDLNKGTLINFTNGGDGVSGYLFTYNDKLKMSIVCSGENNHFYGKTHTEETKRKMSIAKKGKHSNMKGKKMSEETKKHLSNINSGKTHTEETKRKMSIAKKGKSIKGHKQSEETRKKISERMSGLNNKKRKVVLQFDLNDNFIKEWPSLSLAIKIMNNTQIGKCCRGLIDQAGGFKWSYKDNK